MLLQTIARVNRPYEEDGDIKKPCGLIVDFVGMFEKLEKALAFDSDVVKGVIENIELVLEKFKRLMTRDAKKYIELCKPPIDDKAVERAVDVFADKKEREKFFKLYKEIEALYEILSPSPELRDFIEDMGNLGILYVIIKNKYKSRTVFYGDMAKKTECVIKEKTETYGLKETLNTVKIDENTLKALKKKKSTDNTKIINLINSINKTVLEDSEIEPYLKSIGERAENISEAYDDRQVTTQEALEEAEKLVDEINEARRKQKESKFDINTFAIFWTLKKKNIKDPESHAQTINSVFMRFPNCNHNVEEMRQLKAELYKVLLPIADKNKMIELVGKLLEVVP